MVVATQNPIEQQGTYPLPEAQLDRFLFKVLIDHPSRDEEREIVRRLGHRSAMPRLEEFGLTPVADPATLARVREAVTLIRLLRSADRLHRRCDPRHARAFLSSNLALRRVPPTCWPRLCGQRFAVLQGRDFVIPGAM